MRVTQNSINNQFLYNLGKVNERLVDSYNELSSGQKITVSSDDPSAAARVFGMQSQQRSLVQYSENADYADEISTVTYSYVKSLKDIVTEAEELATSASGVTNSDDYETYAEQLNELIETALDTANAKYDGKYIFGATDTANEPYTVTRDANGDVATTLDASNNVVDAVAYAGGTTDASFNIGEGVSISPYSSATQNQEIADMINHLVALRDAMKAGDDTAIKTAATSLADDEDNVVMQMANHAAIESRISTVKSRNTTTATVLTTQVSNLADTDVATATVRYNAMSTAYQAALSAGSKMLSTSILDYLS